VSRRGARGGAVIATLALLVAAGCGSDSLSAQQLHSAAQEACLVATRGLDRIPTPRLPAGGAAFLRRGITVLKPELAALQLLHPGGGLAESYARARNLTHRELGALESTLNGLKAGNDPVVAIKTLQQELLPLERRAAAAWAAAGVPACADN
jgi:hypothetical protein